MRLQSSPACYNSRVPDAWDYKVLPKTPTKKWVAEGRFELRTFRTGSANATDTPRPIPAILTYLHFSVSNVFGCKLKIHVGSLLFATGGHPITTTTCIVNSSLKCVGAKILTNMDYFHFLKKLRHLWTRYIQILIM